MDEPLQTGDGLLARLRIKDRQLTPVQMAGIADLARVHGNGLMEITARGSLQVRGLSQSSQAAFAQGVRAIVALEEGLVVETSPLAGDDPHEIADPRPLREAIIRSAERLNVQLGPKVTVVVDGSGQITLRQLKADIRVTAISPNLWSVVVGSAAAWTGTNAEALEYACVTLQKLGALGPKARATDLLGQPAARSAQIKASPPVGKFDLRRGQALGLVLPFGGATAEAFIAIADAAIQHGISEFRLAPHHGLLALTSNASFRQEAAALGLITEAQDPRLRASACIGNRGCASGHIPARRLAEDLAEHVPVGSHLHVSGCAKGCAHPRPADITIVGRPDGHGLVIGGTAGDSVTAVLRADELESALATR